MPSTPSATNIVASQLTLLSDNFHVASPTSAAYFSKALTSPPKARRREGEEVMSSNESSVSRFKERVERFEEPMKVRKGLEFTWAGETQIPMCMSFVVVPRSET